MTVRYWLLRQMFLIVLDNAVKFSTPHSSVTVTLRPGSVSVRDTGVGIAPADVPLVFDRFHKARTEENRQGSGLGLAIARQIALRHHMSITLQSEPGKGTEVGFDWTAQR